MKKKGNEGSKTILRREAEAKLSNCDLSDDVPPEDAGRLVHELRVHQIELEMQNEELRKTLTQLEESRTQYADLFDFAPVGYLTFDENGLIIDANLTAATQLGTEITRLEKSIFHTFVLDQDKEKSRLHISRVFRTSARQTCEVRLRARGGGEFYARLESIFVETANGGCLCRTSIIDISPAKIAEQELQRAHDELEKRVEERTADLAGANARLQQEISEHKRAEDALRESQRKNHFLADIIKFSSQPFGVWCPAGRIGLINAAFEHLTGYSSDELHSIDWATLLTPPEWQSIERRMLEELHLTGRPVRYEKEYIRKDGNRVPVEVLVNIVRDANGKPLYYYAFVTDITERKRITEALLESRAKLKSALDSMTDAVFISDVNGRFIDFNNAFATFHRFGSKDECLKTLTEYPAILDVSMANGEPAPLDMWAVSRALRGEVVTNAEYSLRRKDTGETWVGSYSFGPIRDENGGIVGSVVVGRDITEIKRAEENLRNSEMELRFLSTKLLSAHEEERRRIAAELHDSLGSSLTAIKIGIENTRMQLGQSKSGAEQLDAPIAWTQHAIDEIRRLMTELRPPVLDDMGVIAALQWFFRQYRKTYPGIHVAVEMNIEEKDVPAPLRIEIFRITQEAFHNISKYSKAEYVDFSLLKEDSAIKLTIEDNGEGFDLDAVHANISQRQGLGLTSMKERAELSGGSFTIHSVLGTGTSLSAIWPLSARLSGTSFS